MKMAESMQGKPSRYVVAFLIGIGIISTGALTASLSLPLPYRQWSTFIFVGAVSLLILFRASSEIFGNTIAKALLPYNIATCFVLAMAMIFTPTSYSYMALEADLILVSIAVFYWVVATVVHFFQKKGRE